MIEILSLPRRPKLDVAEVKNVTFKSGLPINSLPGWELIPLNCKLPMLKCPGNQVIFSKNKIGQSFKHLKQEFDPSVRESLPEYNPLHDSNLKRFYANERNLKRLRENGEITHNNDVICTLKDFNEYRQQLHKTRLYYVLREITRLENEQHDRMLITNAEAITSRDHHNIAARKNSYTEILGRKNKLDYNRAIRFQRMLQKTEDKIARRAAIAEMERSYYEHKKLLSQLKIQRHLQAAKDIQRKHLIKLKKLFQFKKDRLQRNLRQLTDSRFKHDEQTQIMFWEKRLDERIANQGKMKVLLDQMAQQRLEFIENHRQRYKDKWAEIQDEIKKRSRQINKQSKLRPRTRRRKKKPKAEKNLRSVSGIDFCDRNEENIEKLMDHELCEALNAAIDMEEDIKLPLDVNDPIYKAAKFIITHIIKRFDKDLSSNSKICKQVMERVFSFFDVAKHFVLFRSSQIIANIRDSLKENNLTSRPMDLDSRRPTLVSFNRLPMTIGTSSYDIHPLMVVKPTQVRTPTPVGSLASIKVDSETHLFDKQNLPDVCRNELIFIEHYFIKFKRELIVGVGKRVFAAIECHFDNKIMDVRRELLSLDRKFLACQMSKAILSFATNRLNYEATIKLCISTLSSDIIWSLQKHLLKPERDPRGIVEPKTCCADGEELNTKLCLYCHD